MISLEWRRRALALGVASSAVLFLAPIANPVPTVEGVATDKLAHALVVGAVAALLWWNLPAGRWRAASALGLAGVYAAAIELLQGLLTFRSGDVLDLIAGMVGATLWIAAIGFRTRQTAHSAADGSREDSRRGSD